MKTLNKKTLEYLTDNLMCMLETNPNVMYVDDRSYVDHTLDCIVSGADEEQVLYVMRRLIERIAALTPKKPGSEVS